MQKTTRQARPQIVESKSAVRDFRENFQRIKIVHKFSIRSGFFI